MTRSFGQDLDPVVQVVVRRVLAMRRAMCKRATTLGTVKQLIRLYVAQAARDGVEADW